uniref:Cytotoxic T-lymphocyte protein 4 n=1 Tax=Callorhinchus milii TaxID=7868 RepID=V9LL40_CALMI
MRLTNIMEHSRFLVLGFICLQIELGFQDIQVFQPRFLEANSDGEATLVCSHDHTGHAVELQVTIRKTNQEEVCNGTYNSTTKPFQTRARFHCWIQPGEGNVSVTIYGFNSSAIDYYFCKLERVHPPVYQSGIGNGTLIYIAGKKHPSSVALDLKDQLFQVTLLLAVFAFILLIYGIAITFVHFHSKVSE